MTKNRFTKNISEKLLNFLIISLGIIFCLIAFILSVIKGYDAISTIFYSVGASLIASSIVALLTSMYIYKKNKIKELSEYWGLAGLYETRQKMNIECDIYLEDMRDVLHIIAFGLRSFRDSKKQLIETKVKKGLEIKILTMNPESDFLKQREKDEKKAEGSIKYEILQLQKWIEELKNISPNPEKIELKFYNAATLDFYFRIDNHLFIGPYLYGKDSQQTFSLEFDDKAGFKYYSDYFADLWNDKDLCHR